ncbi:RelA/SpoT family protein [Coxiella burnetii]|uniref:RelA/SpoT family protein n=1 Tax=Coxiella burnetii TaxID=777 RepID=UPI000183D0C0|nr:bifunctional (p)ppGpp synthetase/guanosine-3',5'-bis(diphosphate) 3'-pyrophosphohydrolase [Coxiella burnetii]ACJ18043.1 GTP pyrophosphokinase [Coxiella burnetii CbuG_Q212]ATN66447.1 (p)ppGpp synthetase [Coxiella burnetii]OYK86628.1 bifunctional (p)ppGpp synthetase/guanosine-3',5'-bis(diphosphate) 3'-pyrophosphohydrolase [Coxiella burnetii]
MLEKAEEWLATTEPQQDTDLLKRASVLAEKLASTYETPAHEVLIEKGLAIASLLQPLHCDSETLAAALLYPTVTQSGISQEALTDQIGKSVAKLLMGTKRMETIDGMLIRSSGFSQQQNFVDNLRKMLLAMVDDVRIVLIKLSERLTTLRYSRHQPISEQKDIAQKIMDLYAPLANRLGVGQFKWQMEDWAFRYLNPNEYSLISKSLNMRRVEREKYIEKLIEYLEGIFHGSDIEKYNISGRAKHIYSIFRKIQRKQVDFSEIYDTSAVRILVSSLEDCYTALSIVHALWEPIAKEFDDYIAKPKDNGYRSIHTAVIGPEGHNVEIQIRTYGMHEEAELGVAAHWKYKEGKKVASDYEEKINWLREVMDWQKEVSPDVKWRQIFEDHLYVFTPNGDVIDLEAGATPLDFAYRIHTEIGHRCRGARVNGKMVPLTRTLKTGDCVEILMAKESNPSRDWLTLGYLKTRQAQNKVRHWFHKKDREKQAAVGESIWEKTYPKAGLLKNDLNQIYSAFNFSSITDLLAAIGSGDIGIQTILNRLRALKIGDEKTPLESPVREVASASPKAGAFISIEGIGNLLTQLARCCQPIPGDPIIGYITKGRGITIHHQACVNIQQAIKYRPQRVTAVQWGDSFPQQYPVDIDIVAHDRAGVIRDISNCIADEKVAILGLNSRVDKLENRYYIHLTIEIKNLEALEKIIKRLQQLPDILFLKRRR